MLLTATEINRLLYHVLYNGVTDAISYCSDSLNVSTYIKSYIHYIYGASSRTFRICGYHLIHKSATLFVLLQLNRTRGLIM